MHTHDNVHQTHELTCVTGHAHAGSLHWNAQSEGLYAGDFLYTGRQHCCTDKKEGCSCIFNMQNSVISQFSHSVVSDSATPWTAAHQVSLSITNPRSLLKLMSIESVMPSNHLILCRPLLLPLSIFPSIRVFSNELALHVRWPNYCHITWHIFSKLFYDD